MSVKLFESMQQALTTVRPRQPYQIKIDDNRICLVNHNDQLFAIQNSCPHLGESLSKGSVNYLGEIVCPWHSYRFNLKTGEECERRCSDADTFTITEKPDGVYLNV
ncbi:MAG: Rieske 2Fe-2S domain-containing protein [Cyclobacteriaceae bacterium]